MVTIVSIIFNLLFFTLFSYQVITKQLCMLGHKWSRWTEWSKWSMEYDGIVFWKQERVCKRCYKPNNREIGRHRCSDPKKCVHRDKYLSLVDSTTNIKALENELGIDRA